MTDQDHNKHRTEHAYDYLDRKERDERAMRDRSAEDTSTDPAKRGVE